LGSEIGELLGAFGCRVTSLGRDHLDSELDAALVQTDVVVCAVPHTRRTAGLLSRRRLGLLPPGAVVVNVGRGSVLDTDALVDLLRVGVLRAAVLDTTEAEPLPADDPLWTCPGVLLTQHTGGGWSGEWDAKVTLFLDNLERRRAGMPMRNLVRNPAARAVAAAREVIL
jgi:glyoxylate/hydroxypyruvate reductase A